MAVAMALRGKGRLPDTPEGAVKAFFAAAQDGDADAYLSLLSGSLKSSFEETQKQLGAARFGDSLRSSVTRLKGFAVSRSGETADDRVALDVELVFADRSERQRFGLVRHGRGWAIATIEGAVVEKSSAPYGAPVFDFTPAGEGATEPAPSDSPQSLRQ